MCWNMQGVSQGLPPAGWKFSSSFCSVERERERDAIATRKGIHSHLLTYWFPPLCFATSCYCHPFVLHALFCCCCCFLEWRNRVRRKRRRKAVVQLQRMAIDHGGGNRRPPKRAYTIMISRRCRFFHRFGASKRVSAIRTCLNVRIRIEREKRS